jgi:hypothetical protein
VVANGLALCALHHALFDLGVLGLTTERRIRVSGLYVARGDAGRAIDRLVGQALIPPGRPSLPWSWAISVGMAGGSSREQMLKPRSAYRPLSLAYGRAEHHRR